MAEPFQDGSLLGVSDKKQFNILLSARAHEIVAFLQERYGSSQGAVVERLLRDELQRLVQTEGVDPTRLRRLGGKK